MAEASLLHVAESLLVKLAPYAFKEIKSWWGAKNDLQRLVSSIRMIKAGLLDAEKRQEGQDSEGQLVKEWLRRLRNVLYDADDLFDKVITVEESKKTITGREKFSWELSRFFSKSNSAFFLVDIAGRIKKIRKELDSIKSDMAHFTFDHGLSENASCFERETGSVKAVDDIIGREGDEKELMGFLLHDTSKEENLTDVNAIVGFGGLGKTTLAQLLYNNKDVKAEFELRAWACISDTKGEKSKARIILGALQEAEIVGSIEGSSNRVNVQETPVNRLEQEIRVRVHNKKYLLVVDDYWDEDRNTWLYLKGLLRGGTIRSKILVTTRSSKVATAMGVDSPHYLKGLADDKAWKLFERLAFRSAADRENRSLIMMGKEIVRKCNKVPLAIKAIASVLYTCCDDERKWRSIMDCDMLTLERAQNLNILPVLKLSYYHLPSHLKHCFAFCSVFPKGFIIEGEKLIYCWISQGYVERRCDTVQSGLVQIGESYLKELMARSFLQEHREDHWAKGCGRYGSYRMHDLMHDLAQELSGEEVLCIVSSNTRPGHIGENRQNHVSNNARIRHLSLYSNENQQTFNDVLQSGRKKYVRSFIVTYPWCSTTAFKVFSHLRLLDMSSMGIKSLCSSIGEFKHLRSLILSNNDFDYLPEAICKLQNLKILDVSRCSMLQTLPQNLNRLVNLTCLRVGHCFGLRGMPCKLGELSSLESLDELIIDKSSGQYNGLEALAGLVNLRSERLVIQYLERNGGMVRKNDGQKRVDLSSSRVHLDQLSITWPVPSQNRSCWGCENEWDTEEFEFQCLKLPSNLTKLDLRHFPGQVIPEWKAFNNLREVYLNRCTNCRYLPRFSEQPRLQVLDLWGLVELEYIQMGEHDELAAETHCLVKLELYRLPKLKAWSPGMEKLAQRHISSFPHGAIAAFPCFKSLTHLAISYCDELMSLPLPAKDEPYSGSGEFKESLKSILKGNGNCEYFNSGGSSMLNGSESYMSCH